MIHAYLIHSNFSDMAKKLDEHGIKMVDGLFLDLGVSSFQLDEAEEDSVFSLMVLWICVWIDRWNNSRRLDCKCRRKRNC